MRTLCIPDSQLGIRRYADNRRWKNVVYDHAFDVFEAMVEMAVFKKAELVVQPGDLLQSVSLDDAGWLRLLRVLERGRERGLQFVLLGGNHDSVKSYERVGTLDALAGLRNVHVVNSFRPEVVDLNGFKVGGIPHMKSQESFLDVCRTWDREVDVLLLHCSLGVTERFGPNDMQLPFDLLDRLSKFARQVYIGHEHQFMEVQDGKVYQVGSTMPFSFGEVGQRYVLYWSGVDGAVPEKLPIVPIVHFREFEIDWTGLDAFVAALNERLKWPSHILRFVVKGIPAEEHSTAKVMADAVAEQSAAPILFKLERVGDVQIEDVATERARFDLLSEWDEYAAGQKLAPDVATKLRGYIQDALAFQPDEED